jgi:hypothetical protein
LANLQYFNQEKLNRVLFPMQMTELLISTGSWKKNHPTNWNYQQAGVVVWALPEHWVLLSIIFQSAIS